MVGLLGHTATHVPYIMYVVCRLLCGWIAGLGRARDPTRRANDVCAAVRLAERVGSTNEDEEVIT